MTMLTKLSKRLKKKVQKKIFNFLIDLATVAMVAEDTKPMEDEPQTTNKASNHLNLKSWRKWQEAIQKKFGNMKKQQIWRKTHKSLMPPNGRCIKNNWVFKLKHNCFYQACLVACV